MDDFTPQNFESTNINGLWLQNIYENLKNLEMLERIAREGCESIIEYAQIPHPLRAIQIADIRYKNLRFMITEFGLLLTDLTPVIDKTKLESFRTSLEKIEGIIEKRDLFIVETYSASKNALTSSQVTEFFFSTLNIIRTMKINLVKEIAHLLYVKKQEQHQSWR